MNELKTKITGIRNTKGLFTRVQYLLDNGVRSCAIIQTPDYNGGHNQCLLFSSDENEDWYEGLNDFCYVEWVGRPIDLLKDDPWLDSHKEPLHEDPYDSEWSWWVELDTQKDRGLI